MPTNWEYKDFVLEWDSTDPAYRLGTNALIVTARTDLWTDIKPDVMRHLQDWLNAGWEPMTTIGPDCVVLETREQRELGGGGALLGVNTYVYLKEVRIQMRRSKGQPAPNQADVQKVMQSTPESIQHFRNVLHEIVEGNDNTSTNKKASTPISKDLVELIYEDILDLHIQALRDGRIDKDGNIAVAKFITTNLDKAITYGDADRILAELARQFPIHQAIYEKYHRVLIGVG